MKITKHIENKARIYEGKNLFLNNFLNIHKERTKEP